MNENITLVKDIYDFFFTLVDSISLAFLSRSTIRKELHKYLELSIVKFDTCKKEIKIEGFAEIERKINLGEDAFILEEELPSNVEIFGLETGIEYKKGIDFELLEDKIEFLTPATEEIRLVFYDDGYINFELTNKEKAILAEGMALIWLKPKVNREENLKVMLTDKDYTAPSGANLLDKITKLYTMLKREYEEDIIAYSFDNFKGFD